LQALRAGSFAALCFTVGAGPDFSMSRSVHNPWLHRFAVLTALATLALIGIGGLVTSHEAGMAVPDWPTSYGYNMFLFPISSWWHGGNIFYEHSHRLFASGVGLLTTILAVWLWLKESRAWLRWLGVIAFFAVVLQGVLGGLRVVLIKDQIGIFHAALAQLFFVCTCSIALFTSKWWVAQATGLPGRTDRDEAKVQSVIAAMAGQRPALRRWFIATTALIFFQLLLGATMRHQHAGLAITDFPLAYGRLWPATDPVSVAHYNDLRPATNSLNPITAFQVLLQMVHRTVAVLIFVGVSLSAGLALRRLGRKNPLTRLACLWLGLIVIQIGLGAATVLTDKAADVATAHVLLGALSLATGATLCIISCRSLAPVRAAALSPVELQVPDSSALAAGSATGR
jgi:cytochrome c oxidase assembly protein subunit 15